METKKVMAILAAVILSVVTIKAQQIKTDYKEHLTFDKCWMDTNFDGESELDELILVGGNVYIYYKYFGENSSITTIEVVFKGVNGQRRMNAGITNGQVFKVTYENGIAHLLSDNENTLVMAIGQKENETTLLIYNPLIFLDSMKREVEKYK